MNVIRSNFSKPRKLKYKKRTSPCIFTTLAEHFWDIFGASLWQRVTTVQDFSCFGIKMSGWIPVFAKDCKVKNTSEVPYITGTEIPVMPSRVSEWIEPVCLGPNLCCVRF